MFQRKMAVVHSICTEVYTLHKNCSMATNKNAILRYQTLDKCFRNPGRMYFWEDLLEECNRALSELNGSESRISRRQLFDDIRFMESSQGWSIPLERFPFGKKAYYRYSDLSFSINNQPLNETESEQLKSTLMILSRFSGSIHFEWINEIIPILENKLGLVKREREVIAFDSNLDLKGVGHLSPLFSAIVNQQVVRISYRSFTLENPQNFVIHPYYLKQYNNRWFLFGLNQENNNPFWNLALDRIEEIVPTAEKYMFTDIDWDDYFYDIVGVTRFTDSKPIEIKLQCNPSILPYIETKPLHPSQKIERTGLQPIIRLKLIPNYEFESLILSYGENLTVIEPVEIRLKISDRIFVLRNSYGD
jgi:predicted DNA-binding transcriptional regulator YafY